MRQQQQGLTVERARLARERIAMSTRQALLQRELEDIQRRGAELAAQERERQEATAVASAAAPPHPPASVPAAALASAAGAVDPQLSGHANAASASRVCGAVLLAALLVVVWPTLRP